MNHTGNKTVWSYSNCNRLGDFLFGLVISLIICCISQENCIASERLRVEKIIFDYAFLTLDFSEVFSKFFVSVVFTA